jgi:hypothetical protein
MLVTLAVVACALPADRDKSRSHLIVEGLAS